MNYHNQLESFLEKLPPNQTLLLHSCCAPCSSYVLEYLCNYFLITVFYYNPNISQELEYQRREEEQKRLIHSMNENNQGKYKIEILQGKYEPQHFFHAITGLEQEKEGGERCRRCFRLRLEETAKEVKKGGFDYFTTTLTISPLKNAIEINEIGNQIAVEYQVNFLPSDFKKKNGYQRSIELSKKYELYRQDYCGCIFSKIQREKDSII